MDRSRLDAFLERLREEVVEEVLRTTPDLAAQGGLPAVRREVTELLEHLAVAVELEAPGLFAAHVAWTRALGGRRGRTSVLASSLRALETFLRAAAAAPPKTEEVGRESLRLALETVTALQAEPPPRAAAALEVTAYLGEAGSGRRREALARVERWRREEGPVAALLRVAEAQREAGDRWFAGEYPVTVEHRITVTSEAAIHRLQPPTGGKGRAIFACAPGDFHAIGPAIAAALVGHQGWDVESLGADTPADSLAGLVASVKPDLVGIGVAPLTALPGARDAVKAVREAWPGAVVWAGGWAARVAGAGILGVDRVAAVAYGGEPPAGPRTSGPPRPAPFDESDERAPPAADPDASV